MKFRPALALAVLAASPAYAAPYAFTALPSGFTATALNNLGQVAGQAPANPSVPGPPGATVPALFSGGAVTPLGPSLTYADGVYGINDAGGFIGSEQFGRHTLAFAVINGARAAYATPYAALDSLAFTGLNNRGQVAGYSGSPSYNSGGAGDVQSFVSSGGSYVVVDVPGTFQTRASGINDAGQVVGSYITVSGSSPSFVYGKSQGFLYDAGAITTIDRPGAVSTVLVGINDAGEVAGTYTDAAGAQHGFTEAGGVFGDVTGPDGSAFLPRGLNDAGQLIGTFGGAGPSYLATPQAASVPEPASAALLGGFAVLGALGRRRGSRGGSEEARVCDAWLARSVLRRSRTGSGAGKAGQRWRTGG